MENVIDTYKKYYSLIFGVELSDEQVIKNLNTTFALQMQKTYDDLHYMKSLLAYASRIPGDIKITLEKVLNEAIENIQRIDQEIYNLGC